MEPQELTTCEYVGVGFSGTRLEQLVQHLGLRVPCWQAAFILMLGAWTGARHMVNLISGWVSRGKEHICPSTLV